MEQQQRLQSALGDTHRVLRELGGGGMSRVFLAEEVRLGRIMRRLTAITVIIMVPNFVASIYGMNFAHLMPASESSWGFVAVVAFLMVMVAWGFIHSKILGWL